MKNEDKRDRPNGGILVLSLLKDAFYWITKSYPVN